MQSWEYIDSAATSRMLLKWHTHTADVGRPRDNGEQTWTDNTHSRQVHSSTHNCGSILIVQPTTECF